MVKLVNQTIFATKIKEKKLPVFNIVDIRRLFGLSQSAAIKLLYRYNDNGFIVRLKRGIYTLADNLPSDIFLAGKLYEPSYISREFALSYHHVIPETVYEITSITPKSTRRFEKLGKVYSYRKIKKNAFCGYTIEKEGDLSFRIADIEKAFVDTSYFRMLDKLEPLSRFNKEKINFKKALQYALLFENKKLVSVIKEILL